MCLPSDIYRRAYGRSCRRFRGDRLMGTIESSTVKTLAAATEEA